MNAKPSGADGAGLISGKSLRVTRRAYVYLQSLAITSSRNCVRVLNLFMVNMRRSLSCSVSQNIKYNVTTMRLFLAPSEKCAFDIGSCISKKKMPWILFRALSCRGTQYKSKRNVLWSGTFLVHVWNFSRHQKILGPFSWRQYCLWPHLLQPISLRFGYLNS